MKKLNAALLFSALILICGNSEAAQVKPGSPDGLLLVQRLANEASAAFVEQTEALNSQESEGQDKFRLSCEGAKSAILSDLASLEVQASRDLLDAKAALEKVVCPSSDALDFAPASDQILAHDKFFSATVSLRSFVSLN